MYVDVLVTLFKSIKEDICKLVERLKLNVFEVGLDYAYVLRIGDILDISTLRIRIKTQISGGKK